MSTLTTVNVIIHANNEDYEKARAYYRDIMLFEEVQGALLFPILLKSTAILIMTPSVEQERVVYKRNGLPAFSFTVEKNFLSYCLKIHENGALFDMACRHPGGYYARLFDPVDNEFEIWCASDEEDCVVDTDKMPFFYSY